MRKNLHLLLMASPVIATFLSFTTPYVQAEAGPSTSASITASTDGSGRRIYVNDSPAPSSRKTRAAPAFVSKGLVYWSPTAHRWKPVRSAYVRAARSAAAEVSESEQFSSFVRGKPFTQQEIDAAIDEAAVRHNVDPSLVRALIKVESNFNPNAVSRKGVSRSGGVPHFAETRNYVRRITGLYYGGGDPGFRILGGAVHEPVRVQRDARGVLYISNTD